MGKILIVVDMQRDLINGTLKNELAGKIVENVINKIKTYLEKGQKVIFTLDTHEKNYFQTLEGKNLPIIHCLKNTEGWQLDNRIQVLLKKYTEGKDYYCIKKETSGSIDLAITLKENLSGTDTIELVGLYTDTSVVSNSLLLRSCLPNNNILVDSSCCSGVSTVSHMAALEVMKACHIEIL